LIGIIQTNAWPENPSNLKQLSQTPTPLGWCTLKKYTFSAGSVLTAFLFFRLCYVSKVYRVLSWHEGSVGSESQVRSPLTLQRSDLRRERTEDASAIGSAIQVVLVERLGERFEFRGPSRSDNPSKTLKCWTRCRVPHTTCS